jgi:hypothetical protein
MVTLKGPNGPPPNWLVQGARRFGAAGPGVKRIPGLELFELPSVRYVLSVEHTPRKRLGRRLGAPPRRTVRTSTEGDLAVAENWQMLPFSTQVRF